MMKFGKSLSREPRGARPLLRAALVALLLPSCSLLYAAAPAPPKTEAKPAQPADAKTAPAAPLDNDPDAAGLETPAPAEAAKAAPQIPQPQPPDGKWLVDEEGRSYYIDKLPKEEGLYRRLDEKTVRTRWGIPIEVAREDDKFFYYKVFKVELQPLTDRREPTAEEKKAVEEAYRFDTAESRRLRPVPFGRGLPDNGQWRNGFDIVDINGDGHLDIAHGPARKSLSTPIFFLGDGKGNWRRWNEASFPKLPFDYGDAAVADFNGDGKLDMALGMHLRGFAALLGDGKGKFTDASKGLDFQVAGRAGDDGGGFSSRTIAIVDWNQDGRPDILALGEGPRLNLSAQRGEGAPPGGSESYGVVVYLNQGDGTWKRFDQGTGSDQIFGDDLAIGDFNGDKRLDFATASSKMGRKNLVNLSRADGGWDSVDIDPLRPSSYVRTLAAADFDRDGRSDLAVGYISFEQATWRTGIDIFYSRPDGAWQRRVLAVEPGRDAVTGMDAGDLDGDGHSDLAAVTGDGRTWVFLGDGKGFFTRDTVEIPPVPGGCRGYRVRLADLNRDGDDELVASFAGEPSAMFAPDLCVSGGALQAWDVEKVGAEQSASTKNP